MQMQTVKLNVKKTLTPQQVERCAGILEVYQELDSVETLEIRNNGLMVPTLCYHTLGPIGAYVNLDGYEQHHIHAKQFDNAEVLIADIVSMIANDATNDNIADFLADCGVN